MSSDAYQAAKSGGKHHGLYERYRNDPDHLIEKALRSYEKCIEEHESWIKDPSLHVDRAVSERELRHLIEKKWPSDIARLRAERDIMRGILNERETD